jgi:hypothetical protein
MKISYRVVFSFLTPPSAHLLDLGLGLGRRLRERRRRRRRRATRELMSIATLSLALGTEIY